MRRSPSTASTSSGAARSRPRASAARASTEFQGRAAAFRADRHADPASWTAGCSRAGADSSGQERWSQVGDDEASALLVGWEDRPLTAEGGTAEAKLLHLLARYGVLEVVPS